MGVFPRLHAGLPAFSYWGMAAATVVGVAVSIVLHEFGHTMAGRLFGVRVRSITLFVFGGVAAMENEPKTASGELVMALAGPVVSAVLAGAFIGGAELALGRVPLSGVRAQRLIAIAGGIGPVCQAGIAGRLTRALSLKGAMVSRLM